MQLCELEKPIIIAGPCGHSSTKDMVNAAHEANKRGILIVRGSVDKPRTEPGWDGLHDDGIPGLVEVAQMRLIPATEVLTVKRAANIIDRLIQGVQNPEGLLLWIGSRNQNHVDQVAIAKLVSEVPWVTLMVKNQPWRDERHWRGIIKHVTESGEVPMQRLIVCHRGFDPGTDQPRDPNALRNPADFSMAMRIKLDTGATMIIDPSHIGGTTENVLKVTKEVQQYEEGGMRFDGLMLEVGDPLSAKTDAKQHLTWDQLDSLHLLNGRSTLALAALSITQTRGG